MALGRAPKKLEVKLESPLADDRTSTRSVAYRPQSSVHSLPTAVDGRSMPNGLWTLDLLSLAAPTAVASQWMANGL